MATHSPWSSPPRFAASMSAGTCAVSALSPRGRPFSIRGGSDRWMCAWQPVFSLATSSNFFLFAATMRHFQPRRDQYGRHRDLLSLLLSYCNNHVKLIFECRAYNVKSLFNFLQLLTAFPSITYALISPPSPSSLHGLASLYCFCLKIATK